ncbi:DUF5685 family protein [Pseudobutyrivibrio xylanivorans]|uniref:Uncharacterized protein n=1 Tax=Pseudobutyrivibrio xylanivorans DSM 14809 TaxID=1123012 RepID=A0A1M6AAV3_PSEXY|nr:DUF5685 family protein [Pseudobutyrivibrio xylanivorans]SHI33556.1 hypothetical protein SAMN02745725_00170 [Pseudobutyrivibrio xylanivorans DSM 14809]
MFGYINADRSQLSQEDKHTYQSFYCGLCKELGKQAGVKGKMLLNFDLCFLAILLQSLYEPMLNQEDFRCMIHPAKKKTGFSSEAMEYAASMDIILSYHSLMDNYADDGSKLSGMAASSLKKDYERISAQYPRQVKAVEDYIKKLSIAEKSGETNIDLVSGFTGEMLGELFNWKQDSWGQTLHCMGYYMGKFIYLIDAYDDIKKDEKRGSYNPLLFLKKESPKEFECFVKINLTSLMTECAKSFERLPIVDNVDILRNIIYSGVWTRYEYLQLKEKRKNNSKENRK